MSDGSADGRVARLTTFATAGAVTTAQEIASVVLVDIDHADPNVVAEETLCLVATVTARAIEASASEFAHVVSTALEELPLLYRDYIIGAAMVEDPEAAPDADGSVYHRLARARTFYSAHFPPGEFPGSRALGDKMALWMGRVSPPRLPELPVDRLKRLRLVDRVATHTRLALEYARQLSATTTSTDG